MKKIKISRELVYLLALLIMTLGVALMAKADFGVSMVVAPAYILSLKFTFFSFGIAEYCVQLFLLIVMCIIIRKFRVSYLFTFVTVFIYGAVLDGYMWIFSKFELDYIALRIIFCVLGALLTSLGVALFFRTYLSPCSYDQFVKVLATHFRLNMSHFKLGYDIVSLLIAIMMTFSFFGSLKGIGVATVVCAFVNGFIIGKFGKFLDKHFEFFNKFKLCKYFD